MHVSMMFVMLHVFSVIFVPKQTEDFTQGMERVGAQSHQLHRDRG